MIQRITNLQDWQKAMQQYMNAQGTSILQTAELAAMSNPTLYKLLTKDSANPTLTTLLKIGNSLGVSIMVTQTPTYYEKQ